MMNLGTLNFDGLFRDVLREVGRRSRKIVPRDQIFRVPYVFRGNNLAFRECTTHQIILVSGPSECGKTIAALALVHEICITNPGVRAAIVRKEYSSLSTTVVRSFEDKILPDDRECMYQGKLILVTPYGGSHPSAYMYSNGSIIFLYGLDKSVKRLGAELDFIFVNQAEQTTQDDIELLRTRNTGRSGKIKTRRPQLLLDCNPGGTDHFLLRMEKDGVLKKFNVTHEDNPSLWDEERQEWTEQGKQTIEILDALTGVRYLRLRKGVWAGAEGLIFAEFDPEIHGIDFVEVQEDWEVFATLDYGFNHPNVWLIHTIDGDGNLYTLGELSHRQRFVNEIAADLKVFVESFGWTFKRFSEFIGGGDVFARTGSAERTISEQYYDELQRWGNACRRCSQVSGYRSFDVLAVGITRPSPQG